MTKPRWMINLFHATTHGLGNQRLVFASAVAQNRFRACRDWQSVGTAPLIDGELTSSESESQLDVIDPSSLERLWKGLQRHGHACAMKPIAVRCELPPRPQDHLRPDRLAEAMGADHELHRDRRKGGWAAVTGGERVLPESGGYLVEPTLFRNVSPNAWVAAVPAPRAWRRAVSLSLVIARGR